MIRGKLLSPSLMCMNLLQVENQIIKLNNLCDMFHFDIMDGSYVKNFALSLDQLKAIRKITKKSIDVHMMVNYPQEYIDKCAENGASSISIHADRLTKDAFRTINKIHDLNCKAGVVLNPSEPIDYIRYYIDKVDLVTVMTVDPGFAGQPFIDKVLEKIDELAELRNKYKYNFLIQLDGNCNMKSFKKIMESKADIVVVGNSGLFSLDNDIDEAWKIMLNNIEIALGNK